MSSNQSPSPEQIQAARVALNTFAHIGEHYGHSDGVSPKAAMELSQAARTLLAALELSEKRLKGERFIGRLERDLAEDFAGETVEELRRVRNLTNQQEAKS